MCVDEITCARRSHPFEHMSFPSDSSTESFSSLALYIGRLREVQLLVQMGYKAIKANDTRVEVLRPGAAMERVGVQFLEVRVL